MLEGTYLHEQSYEVRGTTHENVCAEKEESIGFSQINPKEMRYR